MVWVGGVVFFLYKMKVKDKCVWGLVVIKLWFKNKIYYFVLKKLLVNFENFFSVLKRN